MDHVRHGALHHIELWVPDLDRAAATWGWLLGELGYELFQDWPGGQSWRSGATYIVLEQSPARTASRHDRCRPGLNHLAFHVASAALVEAMTTAAAQHGWRLMFADEHPYAGGPGHYAAFLENVDGYEAELVAIEFPPPPADQAKAAADETAAAADEAEAAADEAEAAADEALAGTDETQVAAEETQAGADEAEAAADVARAAADEAAAADAPAPPDGAVRPGDAVPPGDSG